MQKLIMSSVKLSYIFMINKLDRLIHQQHILVQQLPLFATSCTHYAHKDTYL